MHFAGFQNPLYNNYSQNNSQNYQDKSHQSLLDIEKKTTRVVENQFNISQNSEYRILRNSISLPLNNNDFSYEDVASLEILPDFQSLLPTTEDIPVSQMPNSSHLSESNLNALAVNSIPIHTISDNNYNPDTPTNLGAIPRGSKRKSLDNTEIIRPVKGRFGSTRPLENSRSATPDYAFPLPNEDDDSFYSPNQPEIPDSPPLPKPDLGALMIEGNEHLARAGSLDANDFRAYPDYLHAISCYSEILKSDFHDLDARASRAKCYASIGCTQDAQTDIRIVLKKNPTHTSAFQMLAHFAEKDKNLTQAYEYYKMLAKSNKAMKVLDSLQKISKSVDEGKL